MTDTEFLIASLRRQLDEAKREIEALKKCLDNTVYWAVLASDLWEKSRRNIMAAARGELERPVLHVDHGKA